MTGFYIDPRIQTYPPHHRFRYSTGWDLRDPQLVTTNNCGFVSDRDFVRDPSAVALIGDSYAEAASLPVPDRPGAQLERALGGGRPVYAMGAAGTALLDYAERIRFAHENFGICDFVIMMERSVARQSLCGSGNVVSQCLDPTTLAPRTEVPGQPAQIKRLLRHSAFAQYLASQLKVVPSRLIGQVFTRAVPAQAAVAAVSGARGADQTLRHKIDAVAKAFLSA